MRDAGQPIQKIQLGCGKRPIRLDFLGTRGCGEVAQPETMAAPEPIGFERATSSLACPTGKPYWKVMSRHLEMSEPRPEEMVMQPRIFCAAMSAAQIE